jgi:8-oxo-dGTP pyrophosphatase MutT (NUDIX family)
VERRSPAKLETSAGGVVFRCTPTGPQFLVILDAYRNWGFPKGHIHEGETGSQAARREILEETGLADLTLHAPLGTIDWYFRLHGELVHKYCHFYLFESQSGEAQPQGAEGITACAWHPIGNALETITYDNAREILGNARIYLPRICRETAESDGLGA